MNTANLSCICNKMINQVKVLHVIVPCDMIPLILAGLRLHMNTANLSCICNKIVNQVNKTLHIIIPCDIILLILAAELGSITITITLKFHDY